MSGKVVSWAMGKVTGSPAAKLVLCKLAENADDRGLCWPSIELVVQHTELAQSTVYKHLASLEAMGLLYQLDLTLEGGGTVKAFQLNIDKLRDAIPAVGKTAKKSPSERKSSPSNRTGIPTDGKSIPSGGIHNKEEPSPEPSLELSSEPAASPADGGDGLFGDDLHPSNAQIVDLAFAAYDQAAARLEWTACQARTESRRRKLGRRLADLGGLEGWKTALEKAEASDFCMGQAPPRPGHPPFKMHFDFLLQQQSLVRLMEGHYDNRGRGSTPARGGFLAAAFGRAASEPS